MKNVVLKYGLIAGVLIAAMFSITLPLCMNGTIDFSNAEWLGYSSMVLAYLAVFVGIRTYRERHSGGTITFGRAFKVGILITLVCSLFYVVAWQIVFWGFIPDFGDRYAAFVIDKLRESGASATVIAAEQEKMAEFMRLYKNPLFNIGITFMEVFPVGLVVTLISAAILRKAGPTDSPATSVVAA
ncbi:MAG TPA: DUF4199 domain-containing protein [Thermoanaerobaculia bacterium]